MEQKLIDTLEQKEATLLFIAQEVNVKGIKKQELRELLKKETEIKAQIKLLRHLLC